MAEEFSASAKVYPTAEHGKFSILDMLDYFEKHGAMRVSDLHIKVGAAPAYRIDGNLVKLKGPAVTPELAKQLIYPLLSNENLRKLRSQYSVDCSYRRGSLQFRINIFRENDGIAGAIRALSLDIPQIEAIGFPNDVWQDIINRRHGLVLLTGSWQIHNNCLVNSSNQRKNCLPNHDRRRPHRIHLSAEILDYLAT